MRRFTEKQYQRQLMIAMVLLAWPSAKTTGSVPLKLALALLPAALMLYVIGLMARRILHSDELEQRTHLAALGVAIVMLAAAFAWLSSGRPALAPTRTSAASRVRGSSMAHPVC